MVCVVGSGTSKGNELTCLYVLDSFTNYKVGPFVLAYLLEASSSLSRACMCFSIEISTELNNHVVKIIYIILSASYIYACMSTQKSTLWTTMQLNCHHFQ